MGERSCSNPRVRALLLVSALAIPSFVQEGGTKAAPIILVSAAVVSAAFILKNGAISQPAQTEVTAGGEASFSFTIVKAGNDVIHAAANARMRTRIPFF